MQRSSKGLLLIVWLKLAWKTSIWQTLPRDFFQSRSRGWFLQDRLILALHSGSMLSSLVHISKLCVCSAAHTVASEIERACSWCLRCAVAWAYPCQDKKAAHTLCSGTRSPLSKQESCALKCSTAQSIPSEVRVCLADAWAVLEHRAASPGPNKQVARLDICIQSSFKANSCSTHADYLFLFTADLLSKLADKLCMQGSVSVLQ